MNTYISLLNYTQQGIANIKESPNRVDQARGLMKSLGGDMPGFYLTIGRYDMVAITQASDDEAAAKALLMIGMGGSIRSETLRAFTEDEYRKIIGSI